MQTHLQANWLDIWHVVEEGKKKNGKVDAIAEFDIVLLCRQHIQLCVCL